MLLRPSACAQRVLPGLRALAAAASSPRPFTASAPAWGYNDEHSLITEQEQGHILEKLDDPAEVERMVRHIRTKSTFGDTMADTILREAVEARQADLAARMAAKDNKELCKHGHVHDVCCGASTGEVEGSE